MSNRPSLLVIMAAAVVGGAVVVALAVVLLDMRARSSRRIQADEEAKQPDPSLAAREESAAKAEGNVSPPLHVAAEQDHPKTEREQRKAKLDAMREELAAKLAETKAARKRKMEEEEKNREVLLQEAPEYVVVAEWRGRGNVALNRVIVIDPKHVNEKDIRLLGERLHEETKKERFAFISIFDDKKAAALARTMPEKMDRLPQAELDFYDKHHLGGYTRNTTTGLYELIVFLDPPDRKQVHVKYKR